MNVQENNMPYISDDNAVIKGYITNLGKYNEGYLVGKYISFPISQDDLQQVYKDIGIGKEYEEFFFTDYEISIDNLSDCLGEYENIVDLNALGERLEEIDYDGELEKFAAVLDLGSYTSNLVDIINLTYNLDNYELIQKSRLN